MTDEHDSDELDAALDAALDDALSAQTPPAADDFWDRVDASLDDVAAERPAVREAAPTGPLAVADTTRAPETERERETDDNVVRLTTMNDTTESTRSPLSLRAAAAVAVLAIGGGLAAIVGGLILSGDDGDDAVDVAAEVTTTTQTEPPVTTVTTTATEETGVSTTACAAGCEDGLVISPLTNADVLDTFGEDVGCWFRAADADTDDDGFDDAVFFSGDFGAVMRIEGELLTFDPDPEAAGIGLWTVDAYSGEPFRLVFSEVGEEVETSIESTDRSATLELLAEEGEGIVTIPGTLGCGV